MGEPLEALPAFISIYGGVINKPVRKNGGTPITAMIEAMPQVQRTRRPINRLGIWRVTKDRSTQD